MSHARAQVKTLNALAVLQYSCSIRVMALHTGEMNARRCGVAPDQALLAPLHARRSYEGIIAPQPALDAVHLCCEQE